MFSFRTDGNDIPLGRFLFEKHPAYQAIDNTPTEVECQDEFQHARKWVPARGLKEKTGHVIEILLDSVA